MKKGLLFLVSLIWMIPAIAQSKDYFKVEQGNAGGNSYPEFYNKKAKKAAQHINDYLQLTLAKTIFAENTDSTGTSTWTYTTYINNKNLLSVSCRGGDGQERHFLFNAATGSLISIQDVFTVNGIAAIRRKMLQHYKEQFSKNNLPFKMEGNEKCVKADIQEFLITSDSLLIFPGNCFNTDTSGQVNQLYTQVGFSTFMLSNYLSEYGKAMFGISRKPRLKKFSSGTVAGLYRGSIDGEAVLLQLDAPFEKSLSGTLYFTQSKKAVPFEGSFKSNRLEISKGAERLSLSIFPGTVSGQRKAGNKVLSNFSLTRQ
ncbi:MAG: hypothetical protein BGO31_17935 [Bacteroidetes bacterium 43-16]|nr:MAG: hypothetical protein BGO31_17935 [Bacteroidetes bacterium 43-16]